MRSESARSSVIHFSVSLSCFKRCVNKKLWAVCMWGYVPGSSVLRGENIWVFITLPLYGKWGKLWHVFVQVPLLFWQSLSWQQAVCKYFSSSQDACGLGLQHFEKYCGLSKMDTTYHLPLNVYVIVLGIGLFVFMLSLIFCCYLFRYAGSSLAGTATKW